MKVNIETLKFPCKFKKKFKMKASLGNLSITKPCKIIIKNNANTLIAYLYEEIDIINYFFKFLIPQLLEQFYTNKEFPIDKDVKTEQGFVRFYEKNNFYKNEIMIF